MDSKHSVIKRLHCTYLFHYSITIWASRQENLSLGFANHLGAEEPAHTDQCLCYLLTGKYP